MKALVFARAGEPRDVLQLADVPAPLPGPETVVVEVQARPIHPADLAFIRGQYRVRPALPQVAGLEGAGIVVAGDGGAAIATQVKWIIQVHHVAFTRTCVLRIFNPVPVGAQTA